MRSKCSVQILALIPELDGNFPVAADLSREVESLDAGALPLLQGLSHGSCVVGASSPAPIWGRCCGSGPGCYMPG
jgi:hypothetical protein